MRNHTLFVFALALAALPVRAQTKPRENDLKLPIGGTPVRSTRSRTSPVSRSGTRR